MAMEQVGKWEQAIRKSDNLVVQVVSNVEDVTLLQPEWESLRKRCRGSIFSSFDWSIEWLRHFNQIAQPRVITIEEEGELVGLAPFSLMEHRAMGIRMRKLSMIGNGVGVAELYDLGILALDNRDDVIDAIIDAIDDLDWNILHLNELRDDYVNRTIYQQVAERWDADEIVQIPCPRTNIPRIDEVIDIASSRTRRTIRKVLGELERENRINYRIVDLPQETSEAAEIYALQHIERWAEKGGSIFGNENLSGFLQSVMRATAEEGRSTIYEVWIDGTLASQMLCLDDGDVMRAYRIGMNNRFAEFSPGNLVAAYAMKRAQDAGFLQFDFGAGPEEFKYRLGAKDVPLIRVQAKRGTVRAVAKISSLPGLKQLVDRSGVKDQALRAFHR
ncbi:MAG: GNAT family N-acetyltransferase [Euryarchaeota archaeon]|nr:GNAT family N-acetyltransferase [Euryarchaeota archaeon]